MKFLMSLVVSADWFIADSEGNISFSSEEDKKILKELMQGSESDCFIVGRKTYQMMRGEIDKPYIIVSHRERERQANKIFTNFPNLVKVLSRYKFGKPLILGGNSIYSKFLGDNYELKTYIVIEKNITLQKGLKLTNRNFGNLMKEKQLGKNTMLLTYERDIKTAF